MKAINIFFLILMTFIFSCKKDEHKPLFQGGNPEPVTNYSIENLPGEAEITYKTDDKNTLYVKALYTVKPGITREAKASKFGNVLKLSAFPYSKEYAVKLIAVGKNEKESTPTEITVHPLTPPYIEVHNNLTFTTNYGGAKIEGENKNKANLMVGIITQDSTGEWTEVKDEFSSSKNIKFAFRGFPPEERKFGIYVRDQWQNYSDTSFYTITPWEEVELDMTGIDQTKYELPGDAGSLSAYPISKMFNGVTGSWVNGYYSDNVTAFPQFFTLYLGEDIFQLSRFKYWQNSNLYYQSSNPKHIRVWGSMNPNQDGTMDNSWYLLGEFDNWKPSGLPPGENSDEDIEKAEEGNEFLFDSHIDSAKYLRFEIVTTYQPRDKFYIVELKLWGREID